MEKSKIAKIVIIVFVILIIIGLLSLIPLPMIYDFVKGEGIESFNEHTVYYKIAFYICYLICLYILYLLYKTFNHIYKVQPFMKNIEKNLKQIAILFMILSLIILVKSIFLPTPLTFGIIVICLVVSLCFYLLSEVIKKGIILKDENDLMV